MRAKMKQDQNCPPQPSTNRQQVGVACILGARPVSPLTVLESGGIGFLEERWAGLKMAVI
jgi:hypothetical protein